MGECQRGVRRRSEVSGATWPFDQKKPGTPEHLWEIEVERLVRRPQPITVGVENHAIGAVVFVDKRERRTTSRLRPGGLRERLYEGCLASA